MSEPTRLVGIDPNLHTVLKDYLGKQPYKEVKNIMIMLDQAVPVTIDDLDEQQKGKLPPPPETDAESSPDTGRKKSKKKSGKKKG